MVLGTRPPTREDGDSSPDVAVVESVVRRLSLHGIPVRTDVGSSGPPTSTEPAPADTLLEVRIGHRGDDGDDRSALSEVWGARTDLATSLHRAQLSALGECDEVRDLGVRSRDLPAAATSGESCMVVVSPGGRGCGDRSTRERLAEAICRTIVDEGRIEGWWSTTFSPTQCGLPPIFSVVIPTCDRSRLVGEAIDSVLAQHVRDLEIIVVDDGHEEPVRPPDDPRIVVLRTGGLRGPAVARNAGIRAARGVHLAFLDDDDLWVPERLDLALLGLRRADVAVCTTRHMGRLARPPREVEGFLGDDILAGTTPCLGATAVDRRVAPLFDETWSGIEDVVWWWELANRASIATVPQVGYLVRLHDGLRGRNTVSVRVDENLRFLSANRSFFRGHRRAAAHRWLRVALLARECGRYGTAARAALMHLRYRPRIPRMVREVVRPRRPPAG